MNFLQDIVRAITGAPNAGNTLQSGRALQKVQPATFQPMQARTLMPLMPQMPPRGANIVMPTVAPHQMQQFSQPQAFSMQPQYGQASNYSTPVQGTQNPGFIPFQGSQGVGPMQAGSNITF